MCVNIAQSAEVEEYAACISECDIKPSDGKVTVLDLYGM